MEVLLFLLGFLKIIGFILLIVLAILILILLIVLFAPIKYELEGEKYSEMKGYAKISWLFGILKLKLQLNSKMDMIIAVKVFWFTIFDSSAEKKVKKQKKKKVKVQVAKKPENSKEKKKNESKQKIKEQSAEKMDKSMYNAKVEEKENIRNNEETATLEHKDETINYKKENEKTHKCSVKSDENLDKPIVRRIKIADIEKEDIDMKVENKTHEKREKENTSKKEELNIEYFKKMPFDEKKKVFDIILKFVKRVLKNILPRKSKIYMEFGTRDPSLTGMLLGAASVAKGVFGENLYVKANFEKVMFECEIILKGSITLVLFLYAAIRLVFEKPVWKMIKIYLKG